ncbi:DUF4136 domain-containing protein [Sphingomonas sp.]|jgi:hypothetical protein|uniref:DUF4136 domain-containing protein n=1 Tax=Sphingomonas sp. TaxID=28214 RepID=UPI002EDB8DE8
MRKWSVAGSTVVALGAMGLAGCATTAPLPPTEVIRYHLGEPIDRGAISVEPLTGGGAPASLEFETYAAAVRSELARNGYAPAAPGARPLFVAVVSYARSNRVGPPRRSPISIGLGGGGFSGGRGGGGVGLGGGVGFPIGGGGNSALVVTELSVTIKRRVDQSPVWEGRAQTAADARAAGSDAATQAAKLASALFMGFPGESGRTIEVR